MTKTLSDSEGNIHNTTAYEYGFAEISLDYSRQNVACRTETTTITNKNNEVVSKTRTYTNQYGEKIKESNVIDDSESGSIYYEYDKDNRLIRTYYQDASGNSVTMSQCTYDFEGRIASETNTDGYTKTYSYNSFGDLVEETDFKGTAITYTYNKLGLVERQSTPIDTNVTSSTSYHYDTAGRLKSTYSGNTGLGDYRHSAYTYDSMGNLSDIAIAVSENITEYTHYTYNNSGKPTEIYTGLTTPFSEDLTSDTYNKTTYTYDKFSNVLSETDAMGLTETYVYNPYGLLVSKTDRNGTTTSYTYDDFGNILTEALTAKNSDIPSATKRYAYDGVNIILVAENGMTTASEYDSLGRLIKETETADGNTIEKAYSYDDFGNKLSQQIKLNNQVVTDASYSYDEGFKLQSVSENETIIATYQYDENGNIVSETTPETTSITEYNKGGFVSKMSNYADETLISEFEYKYDTAGNIKKETDTVNQKLTEYAYDFAGRLTSESYSDYSQSTRWERKITPISLDLYRYDANGNRTFKMSQYGEETKITVSSFDKNNRLIQEKNSDGTITNYTYDPNGNTLTSGTKAFTYDLKNRQIAFADGETTANYTYFPSGLRKSKTVNGKTTNFIWDSTLMVYEFTADDETTYTYGLRLISSDDYTYVLNAHGDVVALLDSNGEVVKRYEYDAFGNELNPEDTDGNPFRYCGEYFDAETGSIYLRARYYNPANGRFSTIDPIRDGTNWYVYCSNNPVVFVDPLGLENVVVSGGAYHQGDGYQYEFIDSALLQIANLNGDATLLVADAGWSESQRNAIEKAADERGIELHWFDSTDILIDYINNGRDRASDPITSFFVFAHGTDSNSGNYAITFGLYTDKNLQLSFHTSLISGVKRFAFAPGAVSKFYACRTGNTFENGNFARSWAWLTGSDTYAFSGSNGRTDYSDILGTWSERHFKTKSWKQWRNTRDDILSSPGEAYMLPRATWFSSMTYFSPMTISAAVRN